MGGRLLPLLLALLGAPGPESVELAEPSPPGPPSTLSPGRAESSRGSWDPRTAPWTLSPAASRAAGRPADSAAAARSSGAGRRERAEAPTPPPWSSRQPHPEAPTAAWMPQAQSEAARADPPSVSPASGPRTQVEGTGPPHVELPGPSLAAVGRPGAARPVGSARTPQEAVAALAELTSGGSAAPQTSGPGQLPGQPEGSEAYGKSRRNPALRAASARPPDPGSRGRLLLPGTAPPESRTHPRLSVGPERRQGEDGSPAAPHKPSMGQQSSGWGWQGPVPTLSAGVSREAVRGSETTPHFTPSPTHEAATSALSPADLPLHAGRAPGARPFPPSPSRPPGQRGLSPTPAGETAATGTRQDARRSSTVPGRAPLRTPSAPPFSHRPDPAEPPPPSGITAGGPASEQPLAGGTDWAAFAPDAPPRPPTSAPQDGFLREEAPRQDPPPTGETMGSAEPPVHLLRGKGRPTPWRSPGPTESAAVATREESPPGRPSRAGLSPGYASTVAARQAGERDAPGQPSVALPSQPTPARAWTWGRGGPSTEAQSWQTWPPARGDPPVASTWLLAAMPEAATRMAPVPPRALHTLVAENQPPLLKAAFLHLPWELVLALEEIPRSIGSPQSPEYQALVRSINTTVAPLFAPLPGFQRLDVKRIRPSLRRPGSLVVVLDSLFVAEAPGWRVALEQLGLPKRLPSGRGAANASVVWSLALVCTCALQCLLPCPCPTARPLDLCAELFSCPAGYDCIVGEVGNASCTSVCHRPYCKNRGICTHPANQAPACQCPVGSDFWFLGLRCDYKVTQQGLLGVACGLLVSLLLIGAAVFGLAARRVRLLLLEARADQAKSSYRRFCRLDDVSAHYWSEPWLASVSSLDNPAFSHSQELLHLQDLEPTHCSCHEGRPAPGGHRKPSGGAAIRPRSLCSWERSSGSGNEHMIDSGKASEVSVCSWPVEPIQWSPFPARPEHAHQPTHKSRRPRSYCEGMELVNLERSWTA